MDSQNGTTTRQRTRRTECHPVDEVHQSAVRQINAEETYKFAYTPTFVAFSRFVSKNLIGFHVPASSPHTSGNLVSYLVGAASGIQNSKKLAHRLYAQIEIKICWPLLIGMLETVSPERLWIGYASGITSSVFATRPRW